MGIFLANKPDHMAKLYVESDVNAKFDVFWIFFIIMTLLILPKQYNWGNQEKLDQWMNWKHP